MAIDAPLTLTLTTAYLAGDMVAPLALADHLQDDEPALAFAYRWAGWWGRRPCDRVLSRIAAAFARRDEVALGDAGKRIRKPWCWYNAAAYVKGMLPLERETFLTRPEARLPWEVFSSLPRNNPYFALFATPRDAMSGLAKALAGLQAILSPPPPKET